LGKYVNTQDIINVPYCVPGPSGYREKNSKKTVIFYCFRQSQRSLCAAVASSLSSPPTTATTNNNTSTTIKNNKRYGINDIDH